MEPKIISSFDSLSYYLCCIGDASIETVELYIQPQG